MHICIPTAKNITQGLEGQKGDFLRAQKKYILFSVQAISVCLTLWIIEKRRRKMLFTESGQAQVRCFKSTFCLFYSYHLNNRIMRDGFVWTHRTLSKKSSFRLMCLSKAEASDLWKINAKVSVLHHFPPIWCNPSKPDHISFSKCRQCYTFLSISLFL